MFITIDPYHDIQFYNEAKQALKNNGYQFKEFINIKTPYDWYLQVDQKPMMVNYDIASSSEERWLVNTVQPLRPNEEYLFLRRNTDNGPKALLKFIENEPMKAARTADYAVFFTIRNREEGETLSKEYPGKIWYLGKYYNNKYRVCLATHRTIRGFLNDNQVLLERNKELSEPGRFESELNFKVFRGNDMLIKFTETPFFENGQFRAVKIKGEIGSKFII